MPMRMMPAVVLLLNLAGAAFCQDRRISGPVLGYLFDHSARAVRTIQGIPAAAALVEGPAFPVALRAAAMSPAAGLIFGVPAMDGALWMLRGHSPAAPVEGVTVDVEKLVLSPDGVAAAVFGAGRAQVLLRPDADLAVSPAFDLPSPAVAAISDGGILLAGTAEGDLVAVSGARFRPIIAAGEPTAAAFLRGSRDAVVASPRQVWLLRDVGRADEWVPLADERDGVDRPRFVAPSGDGHRFFVVNQGGGLLILSRDGAPAVRLECPCEPSALERLDRDAVFRLTEASGDAPVWLLDAREAAPQFRFIPAYRPDPAAAAEEAK